MQKLIILQGIPASGKSTWATEFLKHNPSYMRVCRDNLRRMRGAYWVPEQEGVISEWEDNLVKIALNKHSVLIDATNLNPKTITKWEGIGKSFGAEIEYKLFDTPLEECLRRDALRGEEAVGEAVIKDFYYRYVTDKVVPEKIKAIIQNPELPKAVVVDLDGTLCLHNGRGPFEYLRCTEDLLNKPVAEIIHSFKGSHKILFVSGREDFCRGETLEWLKKYGLNIGDLHMRKTGDHRKDTTIKREIFDEFIRDKYYVEFCLDDRPVVIRMWRELGLFVFDCGLGIEF